MNTFKKRKSVKIDLTESILSPTEHIILKSEVRETSRDKIVEAQNINKRIKIHSNWRSWYKYLLPKRLTLQSNPKIMRWLFWVW